MKIIYTDAIIMYFLLSNMKLNNDSFSLSEEILIKRSSLMYYFVNYISDYEEYRRITLNSILDEYKYNDILKSENDLPTSLNNDIINKFTQLQIEKLCGIVEIEEIEKFTYDEFKDIVKLNLNNTCKIPYIFNEEVNNELYIYLVYIYLCDFKNQKRFYPYIKL